MFKKTHFFFLLFCLLGSISSFSQYRSWDGTGISPFKTYRCLNIYIDIIYDVTKDPQSGEKNWGEGKEEGINKNVPPYAGFYFLPDTNHIGHFPHSLTKRFYEASFGNFNFIGDAVSVSVKQSSVSEDGTFSWQKLLRYAIQLINEKGGLTGKTLHGFDKISDYSIDGDKHVDIVNIMFRNTSATAGKLNSGGMSGTSYNLGLFIEGEKCNANNYTVQLMGADTKIGGNTTVLDHELGHKLLGNNSFHASGGNHWGTYSVCTFMGTQSGYGIMGGGKSSLVCINGFERWRLGWTSSTYNPSKKPIQASNLISEIQQSDQNKTFYLRDFITTGDAIRIELPYKDNDASSSQYLWIENHQIGRNNKEDFYMFSSLPCKDGGIPGVFMYLQVGKDVLESDKRNKVWPSNETDNLKMLSAEGNFDMSYEGLGSDCMGYGGGKRKIFKNAEANSLSGQNDFTPLFITNGPNQLSSKQENSVSIKQLANSMINGGWPRHGENNDVFTDGTVLNLSSNPAPVNAVTNYVTQGRGIIREKSTTRNTRNIYLTGLSIKLTEDHMSSFGDSSMTYRVDIRWDDYEVDQNVRWTGSIVLKENAIIKANAAVVLNQSTVPTRVKRDSISNEFTPTTSFKVEKKGRLALLQKSSFVLEDKSTLTIQADASLMLEKKANLTVKNGTSLIVEKGAFLNIHRRAKIIVEDGALVSIADKKWKKLNTP